MKSLRALIILASFFATSFVVAESESVVVVTSDKKLESLSRKEIRQIFLGAAIAELTPLNLELNTRARNVFNTRVIGLTESRLSAYWAQLKFTGRGEEPSTFSTEEQLVSRCAEMKHCITYLPADYPLPDSLRVIYSF